MGIIRKTTSASVSVFSFLFGSNNLKNTKKNLSEAKSLATEYRNIVTKDREESIDEPDDQAYNKSEYVKRFRNLRIYVWLVLMTCGYYIYCMATALTFYDLFCRAATASILIYLYLALARYMTKVRMAYEALPKKLTEEEGSITWSRFATLVADKPSLLLPLDLNNNN